MYDRWLQETGQPLKHFQSTISAPPLEQVSVHVLLTSECKLSTTVLLVPLAHQSNKGAHIPCIRLHGCGHPTCGSACSLPRAVTHPCDLPFLLRPLPDTHILTWFLLFPSFPIPCGSFLQPWLYRSLSVSFQLVFSENAPCVCVFLMCSWGEVSSKYSNYAIYLFTLLLWVKNVACHISKQRTLQPSSHHITAVPKVSPDGTQDRNRMLSLSHKPLQPPPNGAPWRGLGWENTGYWPQIAEVHIKGMISIRPEFCIFPHLAKC